MPAGAESLRQSVVAAMRDAGLDSVGVTTVEPFERSRRSIDERKGDGLHAGMSFTFRNPSRSTEPARLLRNAASIVAGTLGYLESTPPRPDHPVGRVARYAWRDSYGVLRAGLEAGANTLREHGHRAVVVADSNGLVDRAAAHRAGLGWWGRNSNLIMPDIGSWYVLGSVVTDAELPPTETTVADGCRSCTRCFDACPTDAIVADRTIDARRCLAWLVQQTGVFPRAYRVALGDRIYGCDDCQDACPPGLRTVRRSESAASDERAEAWVSLVEILTASDEDLLAAHGRWYIPDRNPRYLRRNALVVLGNVGPGEVSGSEHVVRTLIADYLTRPDPLLRAHAVWAAARLGWADDARRLAGEDEDPLVRAEVSMADHVPRRGSVPVRISAPR